MDRKRLFYKQKSKQVLWWKRLQEVMLLDCMSTEREKVLKFTLSDKLTINYGKFYVFMSFCESLNSIGYLIYQRKSNSYIVFLEHLKDKDYNIVIRDYSSKLPYKFFLKNLILFGHSAFPFTKENSQWEVSSPILGTRRTQTAKNAHSWIFSDLTKKLMSLIWPEK